MSQPESRRGDNAIHAARTLLHVASGLESFPTIGRCVAYRFLQSLCQAVPLGLLVLVLDRLRTDTVTAGAAVLYTVIAVTALGGQCVLGWLSHRESWIAGLDFSRELRMRVLDHLGRVPMSFHTRRRPGETAATFGEDMQAIEDFAASGLPMLAAIGLPLAIVVELLVIDAPLALAATVSIALAVPVFVLAQRRLSQLMSTRQDLRAEATTRLIEYIQGIAVIRAFNQQDAAHTQLRRALDDVRALDKRLIIQLGLLFGAFNAVVKLGVPLVMLAAAYQLIGGSLDPAGAIVVLVLTLSIYPPITDLLSGTGLLHMAAAGLDRVAAILDTPAQTQPTDSVSIDGHALHLQHVTFGYDTDAPVLHNVSLTAPANSMTAIVGPSGAGKTTLLSLIARFWDPDQGSVRIGGADLREVSSETLFQTVSVVFQDVYLFTGTIFENIAFGRQDADRDDVIAAAKTSHCHDFITRLPDGYDTRVGEAGHTLSGGERQRVSIARAILKAAPIVLLDEATAALDPINEKAIQNALAALTRDKTLLVVAHRLSTIQTADQILVLDGGHIVQRGTHEQLIAQAGLYARFCAQRQEAAGWLGFSQNATLRERR